MQEKEQEILIRREFDHSYLLIRMEASQMEAYPFLMISQNEIPGLLTCKLRYLEDIPYYSYDVSSKRPLIQEYQDRKLYFEDIKELFYNISGILRKTGEFLLEKEDFLLDPECIYKDLETEELFCLYLPGKTAEEENGGVAYRKLADFLLDKADHKDEHAVNCVYQFYKMSKETYFSFEAFTGFLEKEDLMYQAEKRRQNDKKTLVEPKEREMEKEEAEPGRKMPLPLPEEEKPLHWWIPAVTGGIGLVLILFYLLVPYLRYFALYLLLPGSTLIGIAIIFLLRNVYCIWQSKTQKEWMPSLEPVTVEEYFDDMLDNETVYFEEEVCYHLKWKEGHFSKEYFLKELPVTVGKMKESVGLCIEDPSISRLHACFKEQGKEVVLQDLDSTNGTYVNGKRLAAGEIVAVKRNDEIQFGKIIVNVV